MGTITIRNLDDDLISKIKSRAKASGRSMESELRRQLEEGYRNLPAPPDFEPDYAELKRLDEEAERRKGPDGRLPPGPETVEYVRRRRKALFGDRVFPSSVELFREIRDEDPLISPPDAGYP